MIYQKAGINNTKLTVHPGLKSKFDISIEGKLLNFIIISIKVRLPITAWPLVREFDKLTSEVIKDNVHIRYTHAYRFFKKMDIL